MNIRIYPYNSINAISLKFISSNKYPIKLIYTYNPLTELMSSRNHQTERIFSSHIDQTNLNSSNKH